MTTREPRGAYGTDRTQPRPRILFVDDEPEVTRGLRTALRKEPWDIETADSGEDALERMAEALFDVVVSDERMPGLSGADFLALVRESHPDTIRIILSGQANLEAAVQAINAAEIYRFLIKPCPHEEVGLTIREALEQRDEQRRFHDWKLAHVRTDAAELAQKLDRAFERIWIGFQPILRASDGSRFGYEALLRCDDPDVRTPDAMFALAGQLSRTGELGRRIRARIAERMPEVPADAVVLVNCEPSDLDDDGIVGGNDPLVSWAERVVLEVTERESVHEVEGFSGKVERLRELGFGIALDDLGAGYAGLSSFVTIAPNITKFDMELIRNIDRSPTKRKVVESMARACRDLGIQTIAEGVESAEEHDTVVAIGCDLLQGYHYGSAQRDFRAGENRGVA